MTQDNGMNAGEQIEALVRCSDLLDIALEAIQELQNIYDDIQSASNDPADGYHIKVIIDRWEEQWAIMRRFLED